LHNGSGRFVDLAPALFSPNKATIERYKPLRCAKRQFDATRSRRRPQGDGYRRLHLPRYSLANCLRASNAIAWSRRL